MLTDIIQSYWQLDAEMVNIVSWKEFGVQATCNSSLQTLNANFYFFALFHKKQNPLLISFH